MPLKLSVGLSKKLGQPRYGSLGASCQLEIELDSNLWSQSPEELLRQTERAFAACHQAVEVELSRQSSAVQTLPPPDADTSAAAVSTHPANHARYAAPRKATPSQLRAIQTLAERQNVKIEQKAYQAFGIYQLADLTLRQASQLIDELKQWDQPPSPENDLQSSASQA